MLVLGRCFGSTIKDAKKNTHTNISNANRQYKSRVIRCPRPHPSYESRESRGSARRRRLLAWSWGLAAHHASRGGHEPESGRGTLLAGSHRVRSRSVRPPRAAAADGWASSECSIRRPPPVPAERRCSVTPPAAGKLGSIGLRWPTSGDRARGANVGIGDGNDAHSPLVGTSVAEVTGVGVELGQRRLPHGAGD